MNVPQSAKISRPNSPKPLYRLNESKLVNIPEELKDHDHWVLWRYLWRQRRWTKVPFQAHDPEKPADTTDPQTWDTYGAAVEAHRATLRTNNPAAGIGFVFAHEGGFVGFDLDGAITRGGDIDPFAGQILARLSPTYGEISPSGCGIKGIVRGSLPGRGMNRKGLGPEGNIGLEIYAAGRFFTITGDALDDCREIHDHTETVLELYEQYKPKAHEANGKAPGDPPTLADDVLLEKARKAANGGAFKKLYDRGEWDRYSHSEADFSLCCRLGFWFNRNAEAIDRAFRASALYREKWDEMRGDRTYGQITIDAAIGVTEEVYKPCAKETSDLPLFTNFDKEEDQDGETVRKAKPTAALVSELNQITPGWPKRVEERLFVQTDDFQPIYLDKATELFAWIDGKARVCWSEGSAMITQARFFENQRKFAAERLNAIELLPHWPPLPRHYYMHPPVHPATGKLLDEFLGFFKTASEVDTELLRAAILTPFWGGPYGCRPAFHFTGPKEDSEGGRGVGKSTTAALIAELAGGFVDLLEDEDVAALKTRLLSDEGRGKRILRIDNLKTLRFSWSALEGFITTPTISGKQLYRGEGSRPNIFTLFVTMNSGALSKDMAKRSVSIRLKRPTYDGTWDHRVRQFIRESRWALIAEILGALDSEPAMLNPRSRWGVWEREVLAKCSHVEKCQEAIAARSAVLDADDAEGHEIEAFFEAKLIERKHNPAVQSVKIPTAIAAEWLGQYLKKPMAPCYATAYLETKPRRRLRYRRTKSERFWFWKADQAEREPVELQPPLW